MCGVAVVQSKAEPNRARGRALPELMGLRDDESLEIDVLMRQCLYFCHPSFLPSDDDVGFHINEYFFVRLAFPACCFLSLALFPIWV